MTSPVCNGYKILFQMAATMRARTAWCWEHMGAPTHSQIGTANTPTPDACAGSDRSHTSAWKLFRHSGVCTAFNRLFTWNNLTPYRCVHLTCKLKLIWHNWLFPKLYFSPIQVILVLNNLHFLGIPPFIQTAAFIRCRRISVLYTCTCVSSN